MILAEKITALRKRSGWSQEELAMKLNVSRQSVSKWESTASMPDLDKIVKMSQIFGVSTDYLLKDDQEEAMPGIAEEDSSSEHNTLYGEQIRESSVSLDEANRYMELVEKSARLIAAGVAACILAVIPLILLGGMAEFQVIPMSEDMAGGFGVAVLFIIIAAAVAVFITQGMKLEKYEYMEKELLSLEYGIAGIAEVKKENFEPTFKICITVGVVTCIVSIVPLMIAAAFQLPDNVILYCMAILLFLVACAVFLFVWSGMIWGSYQKLLEEGDYTREKKMEHKKNDNLAKVYWGTMTALYLGISFLTGRWHITWVIWPCAGVFYAAVCGIAAMIRKG